MPTELIYLKNEEPTNAYILKSGKIFCKLTDDDILDIDGENHVFGIPELILSKEDKYIHYRMFQVDCETSSSYSKVPYETLLKSFERFNIGFRIAKELASLLQRINRIYAKRKSELSESDRLIQDYSKIFAWVIGKLSNEFEKKRFPWLEHICTKSKSSILYLKGQSFLQLEQQQPIHIESKELGDMNQEYPPGSVVCEQGDKTQDMFILVSGKLRVFVNNEPIAYIEDSGVAFGEMALLLNDPRSATIKAIEPTILTIIKKENLKEVAENKPDFFYNLSINLSRWLETSCSKINQLIDLINENKESKTEKSMGVFGEDYYRQELKDLRNQITELYNKQKMEWLYDISSEMADMIMKARGK